MEQELRSKKLWSMWDDYIRKELSAAIEMQRRRLPIDEKKRLELKEVITSEEQQVREILYTETNDPKFNAGSPKQVQHYLYEVLHLPTKTNHKTHKVSSDDSSIKELISARPEYKTKLDLILASRHYKKLLSSYINVELDPDGLLPGTWTVPGTETGRWSSGKSSRGRGCNLQTIPKPIRYMVCSPPNRIFIQAALSQAEARVVAAEARCTGLMDLFADSSRSVHMENAQAIFNHPVKKDTPEYVLAKKCIHAAHYRMTARKFALEAGLKVKRADEILESYHRNYPEIRRWHEEVKQKILSTGTLTTCFGRSRTFYTGLAEVILTGKLSNDAWKDACSYLPQATVPDITNHGLLSVSEQLDWAWLHHQGHDSIIVSVPIDRAGVSAQVIKKAMSQEICIHGKTFTIPVDVQWGYNMFLMRDYKGESGFTYEEWDEWARGELKNEPIREHFESHVLVDYIEGELS
jgi:DNA polymerase I-like protein with 3'-5' exonuclease and polymerase domains